MNTLRFRKRELFRLLKYEPHAGQIPVHRSNAQRRVVACGTRFGKSTLGAAEAVAEMMAPRDSSLGWIVAPSLPLTERVFLRVSHLVMTHLAHYVIDHVPRHSIRVHNLAGGISELRAMSADRPHALLGAALDHVLVDEASHVRDNVWNEYLSPRLVDRNGRALILGTPQGAGWFYNEFKRGRPGKDPGYESWQLPTWENPFINRDLLEPERARLGEDLYMQQYGAQFAVPPQPCDRCGGPSPDAMGCVTLINDEEPPACPECGEAVGSDGKTVVRLQGNKPFLSIAQIITHGLTDKEIGNLRDWNPPELPE